MKTIIFGLLTLTALSSALAQEALPIKALEFQLGLEHGRLLDRHASPLVYTYSMPHFSLGYINQSQQRQWRVWAQLSLGNMERRNDELRTTEVEGNNTYSAGFGFSYLRSWKQSQQWQHYLGGSLQLNLISDFEAIAEGPWVTAQGRLALDYQLERQLNNGNRLKAQVSLPLLGIVARQPFHFIPRNPGQSPGFASFLDRGTQIVSWDKYQRFDLEVSYQISLGQRWLLIPTYSFSWFRFSDPQPISAYQQQLGLRLGLRL
ncbi:MAG: hypothetical protein AAF433_17980 [Bacteroidota bacterium]